MFELWRARRRRQNVAAAPFRKRPLNVFKPFWRKAFRASGAEGGGHIGAPLLPA